MRNFTAIDFETAIGFRNSVHKVGLVQVKNDIITNSLNLLMQPPKNSYWSNLADLCKKHNIILNLYDALSDDRAYAGAYLKYLDYL